MVKIWVRPEFEALGLPTEIEVIGTLEYSKFSRDPEEAENFLGARMFLQKVYNLAAKLI